ncbi:MAG: DUF4367 domain-containing protein [Clostridia bacterium]|nr:DUF4367 domain-containing protein [Clostridia bacterium]
MNNIEFNNFELLLMAASERNALEDVEEFLAMDTDSIELSPETDVKIRRQIRKSYKQKNVWKPVKIILVACLVIMSVAFTACMSVPQIREAIKNVIVQWYDDYFAVDFSGDSESVTTDVPAMPETPPTTIEHKAYATYLPQKYTIETLIDVPSFYQLNYYTEDRIVAFTLQQRVFDGELDWTDDGGILHENLTVNGQKAFLVSYDSEPDLYMLIWQDNYYQYTLHGYFASEQELIEIAENIKLR